MSMSTHVVGFKPPDEKWRKMKAVWDACTDANTPVPDAVADFFNGAPPDPNGVEVSMKSAIREYKDDTQEGFEVLVNKIPMDVTVIRFYNSY